MACINFPSPVFGPIHSRRLGTSLGINLLPEGGKVCSFDCLYCECGFNKDNRDNTKLPSREKVREVLEKKLIKLKEEGITPNVFTFAGNGEPTSHPQFEEIIEDTRILRDKYFLNAKISVLSNSTFIHKPSVFRALQRVDNNILKLDTVNPDFIKCVDRPNAGFDLKRILEDLKKFNGNLIIQTMFLKVKKDGKVIDNTTDEFVTPWLEEVKKINPREVMIYTIARETPDKDLEKISKGKMDEIGEKVEKAGLKCNVSY